MQANNLTALSGPELVHAWNKLSGENVKRFASREVGAKKLAQLARQKGLDPADYFGIPAFLERVPGDAKHSLNGVHSVAALQAAASPKGRKPAKAPRKTPVPRRVSRSPVVAKPASPKGRGGQNGGRPAKAPPKPRGETKKAQLIAMLKRPDGVLIAEVMETFGWLAHTARAAISAGIGKKLGHKIVSEKTDAGRRYRIA